MIEPLEPRVMFSHAVNISSVGLFNPDGSTAMLDSSRDTWLVIHGLGSSKDDATFQSLASAVAAQSPDHQVLLLNWEKLAAARSISQAEKNAIATADAVAAMLRDANISGLHVNLIGFSMGGLIEDRLARDLGKVNRLIAIDPARGGGYAAHSVYSIAFRAVMNTASSRSATDAVQLTGLPGNSNLRHVESILAFQTMMLRDAGLEPSGNDHVSSLFSISRILNETLPPWKKGGFNATMHCGSIDGVPNAFEPLDLTYVDQATGKKVHRS